MHQVVLITGAGGRVGRMLRTRLARTGRELRLLDLGEQPPPASGESVRILRGDLTDPQVLGRACEGVDAVVHLGGLTGENSWSDLLRVNVDGTRTVFEAARSAAVPRVLVASSVHAAGFYCRDGGRAGSGPGGVPAQVRRSTGPLPGGPPGVPAQVRRGVPAPTGPAGVPAGTPPRPDSYYGWSKAAVEALAALYADRFGMRVFALRLGDCTPEPPGEWALGSWLSPADCTRLVEACLSTPLGGYRVVWGISRNTRRWVSLAEGAEIGYLPQDDAEAYAGQVAPAQGSRAETLGLLGGQHTVRPLGAG